MAPTASRRSTDVPWSSNRNAVTKALVGVAVGYCDTLVDLLRRDIIETARCFGEEYNALIRRATQAAKFQDSVQIHSGTLR
jgi:hypothetical protein